MRSVTGEADTDGLVIAVGGGLVAVDVDGRQLVAALAGRLDYRPVVGDVVTLTVRDDGARVDHIHQRRTWLVRRDRLGRRDQVLAANADLLVVVASVTRPPLRRGLVDRLLVAGLRGGMRTALILTKIDLVSGREALWRATLRDYAAVGCAGVAVDARTAEAVASVRRLIGDARAVFAGHSGVGKSTLVNSLTGGALETQAVNEVIGRGRHTTTTARLVKASGLEIIDLPGIRGFALGGVSEADLQAGFPEIAALAGGCRFPDCHHTGEPGCVVEGAVSPARLQSYRKLLAELRGELDAAPLA
jgi:ribosome biogenesis GTPase / thiamine phosphate phosphatase